MVGQQSPTLQRLRAKPPTMETLKELPSPVRDWSHRSSPTARRLGGWQSTATVLENINSLLTTAPNSEFNSPSTTRPTTTAVEAPTLPLIRQSTAGKDRLPTAPYQLTAPEASILRPRPPQLSETALQAHPPPSREQVVSPPHLSPERAAAYRYNKLAPWEKPSLWRAMRSDQVALVYNSAQLDSPAKQRESDMDTAVSVHEAKSPSRYFALQIRAGSPPTTTDHRGEHHHVSSKRRIVDAW